MTENARPEVTVRRAYQIYLYAVCFVAVFVLLFSTASAVYGLVRIAAPGTTGGVSGVSFSGGSDRGDFQASLTIATDAERDRGLAQFLQGAIFGLLAFGVFRFHWQRSVEVRAELERVTAPPPPVVEEPPAPPPPAPRRRTTRGG